MSLNSVIFALVLVAALGFFLSNARRLVRYLAIGKKEKRTDRIGERIRTTLNVAIGQSKILREPFAGILHAVIFWGFMILLLAVVESILEGLIHGASLAFLGPLYPPLILLQDVIALGVVVAVVVSLVRRIVAPPKRLQVQGHAKLDAILVLTLILGVMVTMFGQNATEAGFGWTSGPHRVRLNLYHMDFRDEFVYAGGLDEDGVPITENAARSIHRAGDW